MGCVIDAFPMCTQSVNTMHYYRGQYTRRYVAGCERRQPRKLIFSFLHVNAVASKLISIKVTRMKVRVRVGCGEQVWRLFSRHTFNGILKHVIPRIEPNGRIRGMQRNLCYGCADCIDMHSALKKKWNFAWKTKTSVLNYLICLLSRNGYCCCIAVLSAQIRFHSKLGELT